jgi:hypothetical protein
MPNMFVPLGPGASFDESRAVINANFAQLDTETVTKTFKQSGGNAIIQGKLPYTGGYGSLYYDSNNIPRILIGIAPDGTMGMFVSKEGQSVLEAFS